MNLAELKPVAWRVKKDYWIYFDTLPSWHIENGFAAESLFAAPPADTAIEPLSDEQIDPLFRQINDMRVVGEKDEWFWFSWGVEMGERAHGIRSSGARHSAGTDRPGSNEKESDATWLEEVERLIDEYGRARWDTGCAESAFDKLGARRYDQDAVDAKTELLAKLRERLKDSQ